MKTSGLRNPRLWSTLLAGYWLTLFVLTHIPVVEPFAPITQHDKFIHIVAYALLAMILATTWQLNSGQLSVAQLGWAWLALILFAVADEWTQGFVGRQSSVEDWIADAAGAAIGLAVFAGLRRWRQRALSQ